MGMRKTILLVGASCHGTSVYSTRIIEHILADVGMTMHEPIMVGDKIMTGEELQEQMMPQLQREVMELKRYEIPECEPTEVVAEESHPFAKFRGKQKWQR